MPFVYDSHVPLTPQGILRQRSVIDSQWSPTTQWLQCTSTDHQHCSSYITELTHGRTKPITFNQLSSYTRSSGLLCLLQYISRMHQTELQAWSRLGIILYTKSTTAVTIWRTDLHGAVYSRKRQSGKCRSSCIRLAVDPTYSRHVHHCSYTVERW